MYLRTDILPLENEGAVVHRFDDLELLTRHFVLELFLDMLFDPLPYFVFPLAGPVFKA
jgi:hypothetical protein